MKRLSILSIALLFALSIVQGQTEKNAAKETKNEKKAERIALRKLEGNIVGEQSKNNFIIDFGTVPNAQWKRVGTFDEVAFTKDENETKAFYDIDGKLVGTTTKKTIADLPAKGQKEIQENYKDYSIDAVILFDDNEANETDMVMYGVQFDDEDNYFVELSKGDKKIVLQVSTDGTVNFLKQL